MTRLAPLLVCALTVLGCIGGEVNPFSESGSSVADGSADAGGDAAAGAHGAGESGSAPECGPGECGAPEDDRCLGQADGSELLGSRQAVGECVADTFCATEGVRTLQTLVCYGEAPVVEDLGLEPCDRQTDGLWVPGSESTSACRATGSCGTSGVVETTVMVCQGGVSVRTVTSTSDCVADSGSAVVIAGSRVDGPCVFPDDICARQGTRTVTHLVCRNGAEVEESFSDECTRSTAGTIIPGTESTACADSADQPCVGHLETWAQVCRGEGASLELVSTGERCDSELEGDVCRLNRWGGSGPLEPAGWCRAGECCWVRGNGRFRPCG